jgi:hypothetical protein
MLIKAKRGRGRNGIKYRDGEGIIGLPLGRACSRGTANRGTRAL